MTEITLTPVISIMVLSAFIGEIMRRIPVDCNSWIPLTTSFVGILFGVYAHFFGMDGFPQADLMTSIVYGLVFGSSTTGIDQIFKQNTQKEVGKL